MLARVMTLLAMLSIAVVTAATSAHAARMAGLQADHALPFDAMMHAAPEGHPCRDETRPHARDESGVCAFVCAGLSVVLPILG